jgi:hypothetical protein
MKRLKTVEAAKREIIELQAFVFLVENYKASTLEKKVLKEYAYTGSMIKVVENLNKELLSKGEDSIDSAFVSQTIQSKPKDELHKLIKSNYLLKTRPSRRK